MVKAKDTDFSFFYNDVYKELIESEDLEDRLPDPEIVAATKLVRPGRALDIGCGVGGNALFMAERGFQVKAIDLSTVAIQHVRAKAASKGLAIQADVASITQELLPDNYRIIANYYVLDHFEEEQALWIVERMKQKTAKGGINVIVTFTVNKTLSQLRKQTMDRPRHYFVANELIGLYKDWKILSCIEGPDIRMIVGQPAIRIMAKKPR